MSSALGACGDSPSCSPSPPFIATITYGSTKVKGPVIEERVAVLETGPWVSKFWVVDGEVGEIGPGLQGIAGLALKGSRQLQQGFRNLLEALKLEEAVEWEGFAVDYGKNGGSLGFGAWDQDIVEKSDAGIIEWVDVRNGDWFLRVDKLNGKSDGAGDYLLDTGTTFMILPKEAIEQYTLQFPSNS